MLEYRYTLQKEHLIESHGFLALHDRSLQKKLISLMISMIIGCVVIALWILRLSIPGFLVAGSLTILVLVCFPKIFWKIVFDRIAKRIETTRIDYHEIHVTFEACLQIQEQQRMISIAYEQIQAIEGTKLDLLLFYEDHGRRNTLIIPNDIIGNEMEELLGFLQKETNG